MNVKRPFCAYYPQKDGGTKYNGLIDFVAGGVSCLTAGMPGGEYGELDGSLPAIASLNASYSTTLSIPSPYLFVPPKERKAISDVRRTFCLFVTFDLLFISLLWIIELNVSIKQTLDDFLLHLFSVF